MLRNSETKNRWKRRKKNEIAKTSRIVDCHCMIYGQIGFFITKYEMVTNLSISPRGSVPASTSPLTTEANYWRHTPSLIISYLDFRGRIWECCTISNGERIYWFATCRFAIQQVVGAL